jgi:RNA polymerase sigma-70 factor (ECF subfamily)
MAQAPGHTGAGAAVEAAGGAAPSDGELLERFVTRRDEAAFGELLRRHGPMVLGVCRRVLHDRHEADDSFQATFLVLVRKAASIIKRPSVGSWLHGVAFRIAWKARARAGRRRAFERRAVNRTTADPVEEVLWQDLFSVLDEEVNRLPEKYREPVVLCYLEGRAYAEAARQLGCSKGTVANRLAKARDRLRDRLARRGILVPLALFPDLLSPHRTEAPVPGVLEEAAARTASLWSAGEEAAHSVPASVASLARAGLSALAWAKLKIVAALVLAALVAGGGAGVLALQAGLWRAAAAEGDAAGTKKGRKTLQDRLEGLPQQTKGAK